LSPGCRAPNAVLRDASTGTAVSLLDLQAGLLDASAASSQAKQAGAFPFPRFTVLLLAGDAALGLPRGLLARWSSAARKLLFTGQERQGQEGREDWEQQQERLHAACGHRSPWSLLTAITHALPLIKQDGTALEHTALIASPHGASTLLRLRVFACPLLIPTALSVLCALCTGARLASAGVARASRRDGGDGAGLWRRGG